MTVSTAAPGSSTAMKSRSSTMSKIGRFFTSGGQGDEHPPQQEPRTASASSNSSHGGRLSSAGTLSRRSSKRMPSGECASSTAASSTAANSGSSSNNASSGTKNFSTHSQDSLHNGNSNNHDPRGKISAVKSNTSVFSGASTVHIPSTPNASSSSAHTTHAPASTPVSASASVSDLNATTAGTGTGPGASTGPNAGSSSSDVNFSRSSSVRTSRSNANSSSGAGGANSNSNYHMRFKILPDGSHQHHLARVKRQEKLGQMVKDWLGAGKKRSVAVSAVPNIFSSSNLNEMDSQIKAALNGENVSAAGAKLPPTLFSMYLREQKMNAHSPTAYAQPSFSVPAAGKVHEHDHDHDHDHESFFEKYGKCQEIIGRGTFGIVRVSHKKVNNREVLYAVKEFTRKLNEPDSKYSKRLTYEFCISSSLKHDGIINAYDLFKDSKGDYYEVMEYCSGGDLYSLIAAAGKLEYSEADCFFKQIMRAVHYMHNMGVSHRDLKPENILLTQDGRVKITDFGSAECFKTAWEDDIELSNDIKGSSPYIAPEQYTSTEFDPRFVDVWSCGVIYMAMRTGRQLWKEAQVDDEFFHEYLRKRKCEKGYEPIEMLKRARCRNVIYSILDPVPERRITTLQVLNSEWVREINCCKS